MPIHIRPARPADRADLFRICLLTADSGTDASALFSDPDYPGLVWSVPYLDFEPAHAFVADDDGEVVGYIVGTPDTNAFEARLDRQWWPKLARHYAGRTATAPFDAKVLDRIANPVHSHAGVAASHPAHLHINLLPPAQSGGWGRKLIEAELASLREAGAKAVHLGVSPTNARAIGFYHHLGFVEIERNAGLHLGKALEG